MHVWRMDPGSRVARSVGPGDVPPHRYAGAMRFEGPISGEAQWNAVSDRRVLEMLDCALVDPGRMERMLKHLYDQKVVPGYWSTNLFFCGPRAAPVAPALDCICDVIDSTRSNELFDGRFRDLIGVREVRFIYARTLVAPVIVSYKDFGVERTCCHRLRGRRAPKLEFQVDCDSPLWNYDWKHPFEVHEEDFKAIADLMALAMDRTGDDFR